jgi:hypothetical protein
VTKYDSTKDLNSRENEAALKDFEVLQVVRSQQPRLGIVEGFYCYF